MELRLESVVGSRRILECLKSSHQIGQGAVRDNFLDYIKYTRFKSAYEPNGEIFAEALINDLYRKNRLDTLIRVCKRLEIDFEDDIQLAEVLEIKRLFEQEKARRKKTRLAGDDNQVNEPEGNTQSPDVDTESTKDADDVLDDAIDKKSHVFISYSTRNKDYAYKLSDKLRDEGFDVWIDNNELRSSEDWWDSIIDALRDAAAFIIIMTPQSRASRWVQRELTLADNWGKPAFPLLLDGENFEIYVRIQFRDVRDGSLPSSEFYDALARYTPRQQRRGIDITVKQDEKNSIPEETPNKIDGANTEQNEGLSEPDQIAETTVKPQRITGLTKPDSNGESLEGKKKKSDTEGAFWRNNIVIILLTLILGVPFSMYGAYATTAPPIANFDADPLCSSGFRVELTDHSVNADRYLWDFGNDTTSTLSRGQIIIYDEFGIYTIQLQVERFAWLGWGTKKATYEQEVRVGFAECATETPSPTPTNTPDVTMTVETNTPTPTVPTNTPSNTPTVPTSTPSNTPTVPTSTPTNTPTPTMPTSTPTDRPISTEIPLCIDVTNNNVSNSCRPDEDDMFLIDTMFVSSDEFEVFISDSTILSSARRSELWVSVPDEHWNHLETIIEYFQVTPPDFNGIAADPDMEAYIANAYCLSQDKRLSTSDELDKADLPTRIEEWTWNSEEDSFWIYGQDASYIGHQFGAFREIYVGFRCVQEFSDIVQE